MIFILWLLVQIWVFFFSVTNLKKWLFVLRSDKILDIFQRPKKLVIFFYGWFTNWFCKSPKKKKKSQTSTKTKKYLQKNHIPVKKFKVGGGNTTQHLLCRIFQFCVWFYTISPCSSFYFKPCSSKKTCPEEGNLLCKDS